MGRREGTLGGELVGSCRPVIVLGAVGDDASFPCGEDGGGD